MSVTCDPAKECQHKIRIIEIVSKAPVNIAAFIFFFIVCSISGGYRRVLITVLL